MSEETWYKMLAVSLALHFFVIGAFSISFKSTRKKIDLSSSYSVNLVGGPGGGGGGAQKRVATQTKKASEKSIPSKEVIPPPAKNKPIPIKKEDLVSLSKKKVPEKKGTSDDDLQSLQEKIRNIKKRTDYVDVTRPAKPGATGSGSGGTGLAGIGEGGGGIVDPLLQKYHNDIQEKIKTAWRKPLNIKKGLETVVGVKIRRDGIVVDIEVVARSGNRLFDESVIRAIRSGEPYPKIPAGIKEEPVDLGFIFRPEDIQ
ncbi:MAG TPA: TonB family protein [Syntrophorhabdaceae bacterium]|nr:TonB family protein [Syntrophorhabdaceae bacterium]